MANFTTHLSVASVGGAVAAYSGWQGGLWTLAEALPLVALVAFGGILPDIDADNSRAIRLIFNLLALLSVIAGAVLLQPHLSAGQLVVVCGGLYLAIRHLAGGIFARFTVHRGSWHSLLAALSCAVFTSALSYRMFTQGETLAWAHGLALGLGYVIHLSLDEMYSVDMLGARIKRSFGTALKLCDFRTPGHSVLMLLLMAGVSLWLPPLSSLLGLLSQGMSITQGPTGLFSGGAWLQGGGWR
ncbi:MULTISPECIES: metal-dependent hydrolase [Halomonadaceae]|uniref:metal-dependent hydrolase n=1 Tax=Halomonadaceae TaxID=28256 RepID=UPI00159A5DF6|nr:MULTISPECIES: metal-dependent hydrolase [Halomonas]QJQ96811.1 hypothetical protein HIO72_17010 [Halomonas sp. PA5]